MEDFLFVWKQIESEYAYFDAKHVDWDLAKMKYIEKVKYVRQKKDVIKILESLIYELYDDHIGLSVNLPESFKAVPSDLLIWAEWINGEAVISELKRPFPIPDVILREGMKIRSINGKDVKESIKDFLVDSALFNIPEARNWALRKMIAGRFNEQVLLLLEEQGDFHNVTINYDRKKNKYSEHATGKILTDSIGYIRINNSLGEYNLIGVFDSILTSFKNLKGLIIDLRDTPSGGNTTVAKGILGRFVDGEQPYQKYLYPNELSPYKIKTGSLDIVFPRGEFKYDKPLAILVGHWTGSMGEGLAIGFDGMKIGDVIGTKTAGLQGSIEDFTLPNLKIKISFPTQKIFHLNGTPREDFVPSMLVDLIKLKRYSTDDPVLAEGLKVIIARQKIKSSY